MDAARHVERPDLLDVQRDAVAGDEAAHPVCREGEEGLAGFGVGPQPCPADGVPLCRQTRRGTDGNSASITARRGTRRSSPDVRTTRCSPLR